MAMWRDPLDELIADLERSIPAAATSAVEIPPMEDVCLLGESILSPDPDTRQRLAADPRVLRVVAYFERLARPRPSADPVDPPR
jgi:hypothetical protein